MLLLRQSTAVTVSFGPAVLNTDGVTLVTNLTGTGSNQTENTSTGIRLSKNGGAFAARHATAGASTYDAFGNYLVPLDTTDTNTLGTLRMQYANAAAFCPLFQDFMVINTALWDALCASSGGAIPNIVAAGVGGLLTGPTTANTGLADVTRLLGTAWLAPGVAGTPDVNAKQLGGTAQTGRDVGASVLLSAGSGTGQLDFTSGVVKANLAQILGTALTETAGQIAAAFKKFFNIGSPAATMDHGILVDTITTYTGNTVQTGDSFTRLGAPAGGSVTADIAAVKTETAEIDAIVDLLPNGGALSNLDAAISSRATSAQILTTTLTEAYAADGAAPTLSQAIFQLLSALYEFSISGTTITCKKLDGSTTAMTFTLDDATNPTSRTRAT